MGLIGKTMLLMAEVCREGPGFLPHQLLEEFLESGILSYRV